MGSIVFFLVIAALLGVRLWASHSVLTELERLPAAERARMARALSQAV